MAHYNLGDQYYSHFIAEKTGLKRLAGLPQLPCLTEFDTMVIKWAVILHITEKSFKAFQFNYDIIECKAFPDFRDIKT